MCRRHGLIDACSRDNISIPWGLGMNLYPPQSRMKNGAGGSCLFLCCKQHPSLSAVLIIHIISICRTIIILNRSAVYDGDWWILRVSLGYACWMDWASSPSHFFFLYLTNDGICVNQVNLTVLQAFSCLLLVSAVKFLFRIQIYIIV